MLNKIAIYTGIAFFVVKFWFMIGFASLSFYAGMNEEDALGMWTDFFFD